jgi:hypothetical protein
MSKLDLLAAVQACMIYLIMCIVDETSENEKNSPELLLVIHASIIPLSLGSTANL